MARKKKPVNGDRVERTDTGTKATYVSKFVKGGHEVLLDDGPKESTVWETATPIVILGTRRRSQCDRCGGKGHMAFYCPEQNTTRREP